MITPLSVTPMAPRAYAAQPPAPSAMQTLGFSNAGSASGGGGLHTGNLAKIGMYAFAGAVLCTFLPVPGGPILGAAAGALLAMLK